ncbi:hypothetical protein KUH32_04735 [Thalassococcus sp. CAU 1522]|uniref:Uncharacterized protein n=1 Tax=Thalassococcus arenae TaxID=2851652 RepID=A0ABS6N4Y4_9RHOB|nr:hypothetical protein [Thalassococcus arenae]MBV2359073.1 hypothetical protein [Thalassococcus arenae]
MIRFVCAFLAFVLVQTAPLAAETNGFLTPRADTPLLVQNERILAAPRRDVTLPTVRRAGPQSFANIDLPQEIQCNGSCLCEGAADCVNLVYSGCCGGAVTCNDSGCSCVNAGGCDADGNP